MCSSGFLSAPEMTDYGWNLSIAIRLRHTYYFKVIAVKDSLVLQLHSTSGVEICFIDVYMRSRIRFLALPKF